MNNNIVELNQKEITTVAGGNAIGTNLKEPAGFNWRNIVNCKNVFIFGSLVFIAIEKHHINDLRNTNKNLTSKIGKLNNELDMMQLFEDVSL